MLQGFWAEAIKESALFCAARALDEDLQQRYRLGRVAAMNPGSLNDWPIQQQRVLFGLMGKLSGQVGVCLTDSMLMIPTKSVSGIHFPTEVSFASCQLCPRENCPNRRASYDPGLYQSRYQAQ
jgi:cobalamin-dependent methionine synthase I